MRRSRIKEEAFRKFVREFTKKWPKSTLIIFGSRARGEANPLSDYDLLAIVEGPINIENPPFIQLFVIDVRKWESEVRRFNTIVVDAVVEGIVLYDGLEIYEKMRERIEEEIRRRGVKRDRRGWVPAN